MLESTWALNISSGPIETIVPFICDDLAKAVHHAGIMILAWYWHSPLDLSSALLLDVLKYNALDDRTLLS